MHIADHCFKVALGICDCRFKLGLQGSILRIGISLCGSFCLGDCLGKIFNGFVESCGVCLGSNCVLQIGYCGFKSSLCSFKFCYLAFKNCNSALSCGNLAVCRCYSRLQIGYCGLQFGNIGSLNSGQRLQSFDCRRCLGFPSCENRNIVFESADISCVGIDPAVCGFQIVFQLIHAGGKCGDQCFKRIVGILQLALERCKSICKLGIVYKGVVQLIYGSLYAIKLSCQLCDIRLIGCDLRQVNAVKRSFDTLHSVFQCIDCISYGTICRFKRVFQFAKLGIGRIAVIEITDHILCRRNGILKSNDLIGKVIVFVCHRLGKLRIGIIQLLKFLCDGRKVDVKLNRNGNILRGHSEAICIIAIVGCRNTVEGNFLDEIAKVGRNGNRYSFANGGACHISRVAAARSTSAVEERNAIRNLLVGNVYLSVRGRHQERVLIFRHLGCRRAGYGHGVNCIARLGRDENGDLTAHKRARGVKGYASVLALANACAIGTKRSIVSRRIGSVARNGGRRGVPTGKGVGILVGCRLVGAALKGGSCAVIIFLCGGHTVYDPSDGILVRRPMCVKGMVVCGLNFRAFLHLRSATCRGIPTRKGIARSGGGRQSSVGAVISNGFACSAYVAAVCIEAYGVCIRLPLGNKVFGTCALPNIIIPIGSIHCLALCIIDLL